MKVEIQRAKNATFISKGDSGNWVVMDSKKDFGGQDAASRPMELLLMGLGGCTAMDIESLINKMRSPAEDFRVEISATRKDEHPKIFTKIHMDFYFKGKSLDEAKVKKAVKLSQEKYCGAAAMFGAVAELTYDIHINEEK